MGSAIAELSGRELDEAVAQELFGDCFIDDGTQPPPAGGGWLKSVPSFHDSWDAMRLIVEEMQRRGFGYVLTDTEDGHKSAFCPTALESIVACGDSLPTAVARAALKAIKDNNGG